MSTKDRKHSNSEGDALFRAAVDGVKPLAARKRNPGIRQPAAVPRKRRKPEAEVIVKAGTFASDFPDTTTEPGEELSFRRDSVSMAIMRDLKRGKVPRQEAVDLHGMTSAEAQTVLREFISEVRSRGSRCVRVVHGKGLGSGNRGAVLKTRVNHWLRQYPEVLAFCSARPAEGGTGAIYVLLKTR